MIEISELDANRCLLEEILLLASNYIHLVVINHLQISTGKRFAAKVLNKTLLKGREHLIRNEIMVLSKISKGHKNIVSLVDYFETMHNRNPF